MSISLSRVAGAVVGLGLAVAGVGVTGTAAQAAVQVKSTSQLVKALRNARPGTTIQVAKGVYQGSFRLTRSGTKSRPITIVGAPGAVLAGPRLKKGITLHLEGASWVAVKKLTIQGGQKGVILDGSHHVLLDRLVVRGIGMEGVHFRNNSTDNVLRYSRISDTGRYKAQFGEGVYIGSAKSNRKNDRSHRNRVLNNKIGPNVRAEGVDVKEYSRGGIIRGNSFDGRGLSGKNFADSWIDVKGNGYLISGNKGVRTLADGFQVHTVVKGWGCGNVFKANVLNLTGAPGKGGAAYGINAPDHSASCKTTVTADNRAIGGTALVSPGIPIT